MYITQSLHRSVQQYPDRIAVRFGKRTRTFRELAQRVARLAGAFETLGLQPGDRVAMLALNSDRYLEYQMAVPWAGGVVNPCNIRWSPAEVLYSIEDCSTCMLLVEDTFLPVAQKIVSESKSLKNTIYCGEGATPAGMLNYEELIEASAPIQDALRRGNEPYGIFYTGGTTGFPKGVIVTHTGLCTSALSLLAEDIAPTGATYLHAAPMFHLADIGIAAAHWNRGSSHSIIPAFDPEKVIDAIYRDQVTHTLLVPTMIQMLVDHPSLQLKKDSLSTLRLIVYGASPISEALLDRAMAALPGVDFAQAYGMTELSPLATISSAYYHSKEGRRHGKLRSAGRAGYCVEVKIVDPEGAEVPRGTVGEVVVRGPNVMQGYWNKPELTAIAVREGWMHTGDAGSMDEDGFIYIVDRIKDMIISGGENIFSAEVEGAIAKHPAVATCAVIGIPSSEWGESVHAVVVLKPSQTATSESIIAHARTLIAGYKCPRTVSFEAALPLSGAGKVLKTKLREPFWSSLKRQVA